MRRLFQGFAFLIVMAALLAWISREEQLAERARRAGAI